MAGGLLASNSVGVAPSTVMKKFVGLVFGLLGSCSTSEKYSVRVAVGVRLASPANRLPATTPEADSVTGSDGGLELV